MIGERIRQARQAKGLNQIELADKVGVSRGTMSSWENGALKPSKKHKEALSLALDVSEAYLDYGDQLPIAELIVCEEFKELAEKTFKEAMNLYIVAGWLSVKRPDVTVEILMDVFFNKLMDNGQVPIESRLRLAPVEDEKGA